MFELNETQAGNEDLIFSLATGELLKSSERVKILFGSEQFDKIKSLDDFDKIARIPESMGGRSTCYPILNDVDFTWSLDGSESSTIFREKGWYNPNGNSLHLLIFVQNQEQKFNLSFKDAIDILEKFDDPSILLDNKLEKVLGLNSKLVEIVLEPLSNLGLGFKLSDFFYEKEDLERIIDWIHSESITLVIQPKLRLKYPKGGWFEMNISKIIIEGQLCFISTVRDITESVKLNRENQRKNLILSKLSEVQNHFLLSKSGQNPYQLFLDNILEIVHAKYGFIGKVGKSEDGKYFMKIQAFTDFQSQSEKSKQLIDELITNEFYFRDFDNLFGACIKYNEIICENDPENSPYSSKKKIPGHPEIKNFLGIPISYGQDILGLIGLGNKENGFFKTDIEDLQPFISTYSVLLRSYQNEQQNIFLEKDSLEKSKILSSILDYSPDTIAVLDEKKEFLFLSPSFKNHFSFGIPEEIAKCKIKTVILKTISEEYLQENGTYRSRIKVEWDENDPFWLESSVNEFLTSSGKRILAVLRDASIQVKAEKKLLQSLKREKEFKSFISDFMGIIAHEFKTPLATILSSLEISNFYLAEEKWESNKKERVLNHLEKMKSEAKKLHKIMINSMVYNYTNKNEIPLHKTTVNLVGFIKNILKENSMESKIQFQAEQLEEAKIIIDEFLVRTAILNLLTNALKYGGNRRKPELKIINMKEKIGFILKDYGMGISDKNLPYIFTPYYRGDNANEIEGTGLGLVAVKNFINIHNGSIKVKSKINVGTVFQVLLPKG